MYLQDASNKMVTYFFWLHLPKSGYSLVDPSLRVSQDKSQYRDLPLIKQLQAVEDLP